MSRIEEKQAEQNSFGGGPKINRAKFDSLVLYEITENELDIIERGSPSSAYLNFAIFLITLGISFLVSLLTVDIQSLFKFTVFVVISVIGFAIGSFLLYLWYRNRSSFSEVIDKIRSRLQAD